MLRCVTREDKIARYAIHADVTSPDGETRSGDVSVRLGYSALSVDLWAGETLVDGKAFPLTVKTLSLDGNPLPADAQVAIHRLRQPLQPHPAGLLHDYWNRGDIEEPAGEFGQEWKEWPAGELVYTGNVDTRSSNPETLSVNLPRGLYRAECTSKDPSGREVRSLLAFMVLPDWDSKVFGIKLPFVAHVRSSTVAVGENLEAVCHRLSRVIKCADLSTTTVNKWRNSRPA